MNSMQIASIISSDAKVLYDKIEFQGTVKINRLLQE